VLHYQHALALAYLANPDSFSGMNRPSVLLVVRNSIVRAMVCLSIFGAGKALAAEAPLKSGVDREGMDTAVKAGDDFYEYVNGNWIKANPIPPEYSRWGAFPKLRDDNLIALREIVEGLSKETGTLDPDRRKIRDFYQTAMDQAARNQAGITPLAEEFARIGGIKSAEEMVPVVGHLHVLGVSALFGFSVSQDAKQSDRYAPHLRQGGLGLHHREYYLGQTDD
jgi:putative endopeptidase